MKFYHPDFKYVLASIAINGNADVEGVYYDGLYFWTIEGLNVNQYWLSSAGTLFLVSSFKSTTTFDPTTVSLDAICGDGLNLWIALSGDDGGSPAVAQKKIWYVSKKGAPLFQLTSATISGPSGKFDDIAWNGLNLFSHHVTSGVPITNVFWMHDVSLNKTVRQVNVSRSLGAIAFNGLNFAAMRTAGISQWMNYDTLFLSPAIATGITPKGCDFGTGHPTVDGVMNWFAGAWVVVVHQ